MLSATMRIPIRIALVLAAGSVVVACGDGDSAHAGKPNGGACMHGAECGSGVCQVPSFMDCAISGGACQGACVNPSPDRPPTITGLPDGQSCTSVPECASRVCTS